MSRVTTAAQRVTRRSPPAVVFAGAYLMAGAGALWLAAAIGTAFAVPHYYRQLGDLHQDPRPGIRAALEVIIVVILSTLASLIATRRAVLAARGRPGARTSARSFCVFAAAVAIALLLIELFTAVQWHRWLMVGVAAITLVFILPTVLLLGLPSAQVYSPRTGRQAPNSQPPAGSSRGRGTQVRPRHSSERHPVPPSGVPPPSPKRETLAGSSPPKAQRAPRHPKDDPADDQLANAEAVRPLWQLRSGQIVWIPPGRHLRFDLSVGEDEHPVDVEIDPIAFLLNDRGLVRGDEDMVFFGQPVHPSGAVTLAADDAGARALHVRIDDVPSDVTTIYLIAQVNAPTRVCAQAVDIDTDSPAGDLVALPKPGRHGMVQIGDLRRITVGWSYKIQPKAIDRDLAALATAAGIDIA